MTTAVSIRPTIPDTAWVADTAVVRGDVTLGAHVSIWFGAVLRGDVDAIRVGDRSNVQDGAILHVTKDYPCRVGKDVTIGHGAVVHGCTVHDGALIAIRATVLDGAVVGEGAIVGAGAVVPPGMEIPPNTVALGVPAKIVGPTDTKKRAAIAHATESYLQTKEAYRQGQY